MENLLSQTGFLLNLASRWQSHHGQAGLVVLAPAYKEFNLQPGQVALSCPSIQVCLCGRWLDAVYTEEG